MKCPHCKTRLVAAKRQNVTIDYCPDCRGIWLDSGELDKIIQQSKHHPILETEKDLHPVNSRLFDDEFGHHYQANKNKIHHGFR